MDFCQTTQPPPSHPFGAIAGTALDVIVVVPLPPSSSPSSSPSSRRHCQQTTNPSVERCPHCNCNFSSLPPPQSSPNKDDNNTTSLDNSTPSSPLPQPTKGVIASSDFYVSFPPSALSYTSPTSASSSSSFSASLSKSKRFGSFFSGSKHSSVVLNSSSNISEASNSGCDDFFGGDDPSNIAINSGDSTQQLQDDIDMPKKGMGTISKRSIDGSSICSGGESMNNESSMKLPQSTEPILQQPQPQQQEQQTQYQKKQTNNRRANVTIQINGRHIPDLDMIFSKKGGANGNDSGDATSCRFMNGNGLRPPSETLYMLIGRNNMEEENDNERQSCCSCHLNAANNGETKQRIISNQTTTANNAGSILHYGRNLMRYSLTTKNGSIVATAEAYLYLWSACDSIIVSDVDGTVTKSDVRGVIDTVIQEKFQHVHTGICKFFHDLLAFRSLDGELQEEEDPLLLEEGYDEDGQDVTMRNSNNKANNVREGEIRFLYLSSRPISIISYTRKLLVSVFQNHHGDATLQSLSGAMLPNTNHSSKKVGLPPGPILCHTGSLSSVLYAELVAKNVFEFKADVLARQVVLPFVAARGEEWKYRVKDDVEDCYRGQLDKLSEEEDDVDRSYSFGDSSRGQSVSPFRWDDRLFLAGFGNKETDAMGYEMAGMDRRDIYIINKESLIICMGDGRSNSDISVDRRMCEAENLRSIQPIGSSGSALEDLEWSITDSCCTGTGEVVDQAVTNVSTSQKLELDNEEMKSVSSCSNFTSNGHAIELCLSSDELRRSTSEPDNFSNSTTVDICITDEPSQPKANGKNKNKLKKTKSSMQSIKQSVRAFSSKKSIKHFPSFASNYSNNSGSKQYYEGYTDPRLLEAVRGRMIRYK